MAKLNIETRKEIVSKEISREPDECPLCHLKITPEFIVASSKRDYPFMEYMEVVYGCTSNACNRLFIAYYSRETSPPGIKYGLKYTAPYTPKTRDFEDEIGLLSPRFVEIYNQALISEKFELTDICGPGYRKSLEFLIKDYLINYEKINPEEIKRKLLGSCFNEYFKDGPLKQCAERANWLGNDETHYERKWVEKDIDDLKKLIDLTVHWISINILASKYKEDMPKR